VVYLESCVSLLIMPTIAISRTTGRYFYLLILYRTFNMSMKIPDLLELS